MTIKMKQCNDCTSLCSNSASKCQVCGSSNLVKGSYRTKQEEEYKEYLKSTQNEVIQCSQCSSPVPIKNGKGYCVYCDDEIFTKNPSSYKESLC